MRCSDWTVGAIYRRPVGYAAGTSRAARASPCAARQPSAPGELRPASCSRPGSNAAIRRSTTAAGAATRCNSTRHYELWQHDFQLAREIGITHIRYGPPLHLVLRGAGPLRLGLLRPADGGAARLRPRADRRPLPLRRAVLARRFPEPRHRPRAGGICRRLRRALSRGCASTRRSTRCTSARG